MNESEHPPETPSSEQPPPQQEVKRELVEFLKMVVWFLILFYTLRTYVIEGYEVQGPSMEPTLVNGERILVFKLPHYLSEWFAWFDPIEPTDIIVFESLDDANKRFVKRVIAEGPPASQGNTVIAGEHAEATGVNAVPIEIRGAAVYVNNQRLEEDYLPAEIDFNSNSGPVYLGAGEYYVLGDNREVSKDSRSFGPINDRYVIGHAVLRFWPLNRISLLD